MSDNIKKCVVIALGYFDSVHRGHKRVIERAVLEAKKTCASSVVFTFKDNLKAVLLDRSEKVVYTACEREVFIKELGVDEIYFAPATNEFLSMDKSVFLDKLNEKYQITAYVSGEDYCFGKFGSGNTEDIKKYALEHNQTAIIVETLNFDKGKVSTTAIKEFLTCGEIDKANALLGRAYSITGEVFKDRKVGSKLGFPTVNIKIDSDKHHLKNGVYAGKIEVKGKTYKAIINYGARPTFNLEKVLVEAHIIDFNGELYGQTLTVQFERFLRDIIKFESQEKLKEQLKKDLFMVNNYD